MKKTLYIQIDNNSLPEGCGEDVEVLDCRCINDFSSMVGDALVSDLKDKKGKPLYRLINPVGQLLMDFKGVDEKAFNAIAEELYDILGNLLHKGIENSHFAFKLPQQYIDWLTDHENKYYNVVGSNCQSSGNIILLDLVDSKDCFISSLCSKISPFINNNKNVNLVFSNQSISDNSWISKILYQNYPKRIEIQNYNDWQTLMMQKRKETKKVDNKLSWGEKLVALGVGAMIVGAAIQSNSDKNDNKKTVTKKQP